MNWIKCTDRLPDTTGGSSKNCLVIDKSGDCYVACLVFLKAGGNRKEDRTYWSEQSTGCGCCGEDIEPIYWMPLPPPPENEE